MGINMSLTQWWFAIGKNHARDGKPEAFVLKPRQLETYTPEEKNAAARAYSAGYEAGSPDVEKP